MLPWRTDATRVAFHNKVKMAEVCSESRPLRDQVNPRIKPYYLDSFGSKSIGEPNWKPHPRNAFSIEGTQDNSPLGGNGLDWFSSLRCPPAEEYHRVSLSRKAPSVEDATPKEPIITREEAAVQHPIPQLTGDDDREPTGSNSATQSRSAIRQAQQTADVDEDFENIFRRRPLEMTVEMSLGVRKKVSSKRNDIPLASLGDKTYQVPEYAKDFHKHGSTLSVVDFGGSLKCVPDTFVPLQDLPLRPSKTFEQKERERKKLQEICDVQDLDSWQPAKALSPSLQLPPGTHM